MMDLKTISMQVTPHSQLIFDKSMYDLFSYKERLFCNKHTKENSHFFSNLLLKFIAKKT